MRSGFLRVAAMMLIPLALPCHGEAQELAGSFDQLRVVVRQGERIRVTDTKGGEVTGRLVDLGTSSLSLQVNGTRRDFSEDEISTIRARRPDSLANGALWGLGAGAGVGLWVGSAIASGEENAGALIPIVALVYGGIGAGIGVGVDALISGQRIIYAGRAKASARLFLTPVVAVTHRSLLVSVRF